MQSRIKDETHIKLKIKFGQNWKINRARTLAESRKGEHFSVVTNFGSKKFVRLRSENFEQMWLKFQDLPEFEHEILRPNTLTNEFN